MDRRRFFGLAASLFGVVLSPLTLAVGQRQKSNLIAYRAALANKPWLSAYRSVDATSYNARATITGQWPEELAGTLYRNEPTRHEIGDFRYHHWFDGDGMVQAFRIGSNGVKHQARLVQTHKLTAEQAAGHPLYSGFDTALAHPKPVNHPDEMNTANISVLPHNNKLLALWEAGSPWEIDPATLETRGIHIFSDETQGVPFSAHPRVEPDGTVWNFGYVSWVKLLVLWHIDPHGQIVKMGKIPCDPISMPHDFIVTQRYIVLMIPPLDFAPEDARTFLRAHRWRPDQPIRLLMVDKNDFSLIKQLELPSQWV